MKKLYSIIILAVSLLVTSSAWSQGSVTATYSTGDISTDESFTSIPGTSSCPGLLDVVIPAGNIVASVDVSYDMTAGGGGWMSEQRSWLYCSTTSNGEATISSGSGSSAGTINYSRTGLGIADGASGTVSFEMHAGRSYGGSGCSTVYNKVVDGTWVITVNYIPAPSCLFPSALTASGVTATTVDLAWTAGDSETLWDIELVDVTASGSATGTPTTEDVTTNPYTLSGLTAQNNYQVYLRADCGGGDTSDWVGPVSFTTTCNATITPYTEDFETFTTSTAAFTNENCWSSSGGSYFWEMAAGTDLSSSSTGPNPSITTGNYFFTEASAGSTGSTTSLTTFIDLSSLTVPLLSFDYHMYGSNMGSLDVIINSDTVLTLTGQQQTSDASPFITADVDLSSYAGQSVTVTFRGTRGAGWYGDIAIDNVSFVETPSCLNPSALTASGETATTVDLAWTAGGTETLWDIELVDVTASGSATGTPTTEDVTTNPYTLTGLTAENDYQVYLRADCGAGDTSDWVGPVSFTTLATCPVPSALTASGETATTVDLDWTDGDSETLWDIELVDVTASGSATGTPTTEDVTTNPYTLSGLTAQNDYQIYLRADCGAGDTSDWVGPVSFTTLCGTASLPFSEDFENAASAPDCWTVSSSSSRNWTFRTSGTYGNTISDNTSGSGYFAIVDASSGYGAGVTLASPFVDVSSLSVPALKFYLHHYATSGNSNSISVDVYDGANWITVYTDSSNDTNSWEEVIVSLGALTITGDIKVRFVVDTTAGSNFYNDIGVDDVSFVEAPSCSNPYALTASGETATTVDLAWTAGGTETLWDLELVDVTASGSATGTPTTEDVTTNPYTLTGLTSANSYQVYLRADCGAGDTSDWVGPVSFTTLATCPVPTALAASGETATTVDLDWTAGDSETLWDLELVDVTASGSATGTPTTEDVTTNPYTLSGLTANNDYQIYLRADCGAGDTSDWVGPISFTTLCNAYTIPYTEGFETGYTHNTAVGGCLFQESIEGTSFWRANDTYTTYNRTPRTGSWNAFLDWSDTDWLFINVSLTGGQSYDFEMYARQDGSGSANANITVSYGDTAAAASMTNSIVAETGIINGEYQQIAGSFTPSTTGSYYIGVKGYINNSPYYISIDDISIEETPACASPIGLSVAAATADTASASWTAATGATTYQYELVDVTAGGTATGTPTGSTATETLTIGSLIEGNQYGLLIRTICGLSTSAWSTQVNWTNILAPDCVTNLSPADGSTSAPVVVLTWDAPTTGPTVVDYEVFISTDNITFISLGTTTATSMETAFNANATAYYKVESRNAGGSSESCSIQTITTNQDGLACTTPIIDNEGTNYQTYHKYYGQYSSQYSSFTTTVAGDLTVSSCASSVDTYLILYNSNCEELTYDDDNCGSQETLTITNVLPNQEYIIRWFARWSGSDFDYEITQTTPCSGPRTTWDGTSWSNGAPDANSYAIISGAYSTGTDGDVTACVMQVDASVTIDGTTDAAIGEVLVMAGNTLTIDETSSLTVSGDFTNNGTVTLNSTADDYSSLIVTGTASGDIVYNRYVNVYDDTAGGGWDLVCSPVGMSIADFITANGSNIQVLGDDYAFSQFNNATGQWERYATASQTGNFEAGKGYSMATTGGSTVAFTGAMQTADQSINIINNNGLNGVGRRWNLVSNPFPSYINGNAAAGTNNFMDANSAVIDSEFLAVYGWNGSSYTIYNNLTGTDTDTPAFSIAPGQGFWVAAASESEVALNFTAAMRTTTGTGDFVSGPQLLTYNVAVKLYNGEIEKAATNFYFRDGLSLDIDPGYDAAAFNQSMALSTRLPQGSQETAFGINAMGMDAMQNTRVPLEIRQNAGQAFRVSIADMDLPEDIYVYLEDTLNGTLTSLKDGDFELVAQSNLSGSDRFFIVFKSNSVLSNGDTLGINALNVYKANTDSFVTIAGISPELGKLNVSLYNILGQTVREKALSSATATQRVSTQGLASGLYIVQIRSGNQTTVKKIIVK